VALIIPGAVRDTTAANHVRHRLHAEDQIWVEKNCYVDLWIELLHALGMQPEAMLGFAVAVDFEGDQWTFFKPGLEDLRTLYGVNVQELTVWKPLIEHAAEHLANGKLISTEVDAFWLPDTAGTDYRTQHSKTTIVLAGIDPAALRLRYFHNAGVFELAGEDFKRIFHVDPAAHADGAFLPFYAELIRLDTCIVRTQADLAARSFKLLRRSLAQRPRSNPVKRFAERLSQDLPMLQERGLAYYHAWAFASTRQAGAAFELAARHLYWLTQCGYPSLEDAAGCLEQASQAHKALILKGARAVNSRKSLEIAPFAEQAGTAWDRAMASLEAALLCPAASATMATPATTA
jgi:Domain of unknown function (DUF1839)